MLVLSVTEKQSSMWCVLGGLQKSFVGGVTLHSPGAFCCFVCLWMAFTEVQVPRQAGEMDTWN